MTIARLADHPAFVHQLAPLLHAEWGHLRPGATLDDRIGMLRRYAQRDALPLALVYHERGELCGTASLVEQELAERPELSPWLAGVYVLEAHRGRGIGAALVRAVEDTARQMGFTQLFLLTAGEERFYASRGWRVVEQRQEHGETVTTMTTTLTGASPER